jgi:hypothetical protein
MSYEKAMKRHKRGNMYFGFSAASSPTGNREIITCWLNIKRWFEDRHNVKDKKFIRECIREEIETYRKLAAKTTGW